VHPIAGRRHGFAAAGTHPFSRPEEQQVTPKERYRGIATTYQALARELVIFGCHVPVGLADREAAVGVLNRARVWLAPLLALSASSPFWQGADTGYASYRSELWGRWPLAGPPGVFASHADYDALVQASSGQMWEQPGWRLGPIFLHMPMPSMGAFYLVSTGVLAALCAREETGRGQHVPTSLFAGAMPYTPRRA